MAAEEEQAAAAAAGASAFVVAALYKFSRLDDVEALREALAQFCEEHGVKGTLLLAEEGINGTVSGTREGIDALLARLRSDPRLADLEHKESVHQRMPFQRLKVRVKKEIVPLGLPAVDPTRQVGTYVPPRDWNALISDPDVLVIDTRNKYEVGIGSFERAIDPKTDSFRELPSVCDSLLAGVDKDRKIAMFCTGGIRCEKSTALLRQRGFHNVYHLKGGILKYLEEVPESASLWRGECFVFDDRVSVGHDLRPGSHRPCGGCRHPLSPAERAAPTFREGVHCAHCLHTASPAQRQRAEARMRHIEAARSRQRTRPAPPQSARPPPPPPRSSTAAVGNSS